MTFAPKRLLLAGLVATVAAAAMAQTPPAPAADGKPGMQHRMGKHDPARMKEFMAKRQAELKQKLAITPAQESAWTAWTAALQPPATRPERLSREEIARLTTPERIEKMRAQRAQRQSLMDKRADATNTFYAALNAEQKKVFDAETVRFAGGGRHGGHGGGHGGHGMHQKS
ncbi:MAG: Spy/CpxP family protein refolding chaperone [Ramlibacter sp.]